MSLSAGPPQPRPSQARHSGVQDAVVVGSGPNGLAAAITLAKSGRSVTVLEAAPTPGGGTRTAELTLPGYRHDVCSAFHPLLGGSPFFAGLNLHGSSAGGGLELIQPEVAFAHPLDDGRAGLAHHSLAKTIEGLGSDGAAWQRKVGWVADSWGTLGPEILSSALGVPRRPLGMSRFALRSVPSASLAARSFQTDEARGLFAGAAAHSFLSLHAPLTAATGVVLAALAHVAGWPVVRGGSERIADAMVGLLSQLGVEIACNSPVRSLNDIPASKVVLFDLAPSQVTAIVGDELPRRFTRQFDRYKPGPGVFKLDYALSEPIPWTNQGVRAAGTVHVGGTIAEVAAAEAEMRAGRHPDRPFVLVGQQSVIDPSRTPGDGHTLWAYCHVPNGSDVDMSEQIERQIERFAPGFRETILARHKAGPSWFESYNHSLIGGDIGGGDAGGRQLLARPTWSPHPYRTPNPRLFLCSAATPPGAGVHGMSGFHAATDALKTTLS